MAMNINILKATPAMRPCEAPNGRATQDQRPRLMYAAGPAADQSTAEIAGRLVDERTVEWFISARAMFTRWRSPPDC